MFLLDQTFGFRTDGMLKEWQGRGKGRSLEGFDKICKISTLARAMFHNNTQYSQHSKYSQYFTIFKIFAIFQNDTEWSPLHH